MRKDFVRMTLKPEDDTGRASAKVSVLRQFFEGGEQDIPYPQRRESDEQQRPAAPRVRPASGPGRHDRHDHLGDNDQRRDDERGKSFFAVRERLTGEWQHRRVGQLEQKHAAGEYEQAAVFRKAP